MPCSITRTPTGSISKVLSSQGVESELYNQIASLPFIQNGEEALEVYLQTESDKIFSKINSLEGVERFPSGEPKISFQVSNRIVTNYKDALLNSAGESFTIGFQGESEFIPLQEVNTSISPDTSTGIINNLILDGVLNPSKVKVGNEFRLQGAGDNITSITFNNGEALQILNSETNAYTIDNNTLKLKGNAVLEDTLGTGKSTQEFFGNVVTGGDVRYEPSKSYEYEEEFSGSALEFKNNYDSKTGNFDEHIATSIPTFRETQVKKGNAIVQLLKNKGNSVVYDLGGSEGSWVKTITEESGGSIKTINLDPSPEMQASFNKNKPENSEMSLEAFYQGWDDVKTHKPKQKADVVHESMMFQFIDNNGERIDYINEVKDKYLKDDGLFITEEKFQMNDPAEYKANEDLKVPHKDKYYSKAQQSLKADEVLVGMKANQANFDQYMTELRSKFNYVEAYWSSGNFRGIIASDNKSQVDKFLKELGDTSNNYTAPTNNLESSVKSFNTSVTSWVQAIKQNNPELYNQGLNLIEQEGQQYIDSVTESQPKLEASQILEAALNEAINDNGAKLIAEKSSGLKGWLDQLWDYISKAMGISSISQEDVKNLSLEEYSTAVAIDILKGNTIEGLENSEPGQGGELIVNTLREPVVNNTIGINTTNYPSESVVELPKYSLTDIIKKYEGRVFITTSDATTVALDSNGELIQGGPGYLSLRENVENGIGFAALDSKGAKSISSKVYKIGKGSPVAVLVMVQNPSATLGNGYGGDFLFNAFNRATENLSKTKVKSFTGSLKTVVGNMFDKYVKDSTKKGFIAKDHRKKVVDSIENIADMTLEDFHNTFISDTNFEFRRNLMKTLVFDQSKKSNNKDVKAVRETLSQIGFNYQQFADMYMDRGVVSPETLENDKLGVVIGGFEMRTDFSSEQDMTDYTMVAQDKGVQHKMFNGKLPSEGNFLLDAGYPVDENFASYAVPNILIKPEQLEFVNSLISEWSSKFPQGTTYTDLKAQDSISFKAYLANFYPDTLFTAPAKPSIDVARGIGFRTTETASEDMLRDYTGSNPYKISDVVETTDANKFSEAMKSALGNRPNSAKQVDFVTAEKAQSILDTGGKLFLTKDNKAGAYVQVDGYMGGLFKDPKSNKTRAAKVLQDVRISAGGKFFDAFGETESIHLESTYIKNGFIPVARMEFNEEFAPENWESTTLSSRPENVFFVYAPGIQSSVGDGIVNNDYDSAYDMAKNFNVETDSIKRQNPLKESNLGNELIDVLIDNGEVTPIDC